MFFFFLFREEGVSSIHVHCNRTNFRLRLIFKFCKRPRFVKIYATPYMCTCTCMFVGKSESAKFCFCEKGLGGKCECTLVKTFVFTVVQTVGLQVSTSN